MAHYSQTQKYSFFSLVLLQSIFFLQLNKVNSAEETVSFLFDGFHRVQENLILQRDAQVTSYSDEWLELTKEPEYHTPVSGSIGRALYAVPIHIWDRETNTVASFQTNFTFVINSFEEGKSAEGLAFFLAPVDTQPPEGAGGLLGIFSNNKSIDDNIVAVEIDTFSNPEWDPEGPHIGIDISSIKSKKSTPFTLLNTDLAEAYVSISYDAHTYSLSVYFTYTWHPGYNHTLVEEVNLREVLPEWVRVGFSATTGDSADLVETHHIYTWSFYSEFSDYSESKKRFKNSHIFLN